MEYRTDLLYSIAEYSDNSQGLLTLGDYREVVLADGKRILLYPYLMQTGYTRGVSKNDPRRRMRHDEAIRMIAPAYAKHYNDVGIDEHWTIEEAEDMLRWQLGQSMGRYFFVKWAKDMETNKEFPVGFLCAYTKPYQGGKMLWDAEIFVLPEYRQYGIATELNTVLFTVAKSSGVNYFEALTYEDNNGNPWKIWEKLGFSRTDLIHIHGEVDQILSNLEEKAPKL